MTEPLVSLVPIGRDQAFVLANLFELYVHDFSEHVPIALKPSGRFELPVDERWWTSDDRFPFFLRRHGELVGFALVQRGSRVGPDQSAMDVAEFFVVRGARRQGVGLAAAGALFEAFPGRWQIRIRRSNPGARGFWLRAAQGFIAPDARLEPFQAQGVAWELLSLDSSVAPGGPSTARFRDRAR